MRLPDFLQFTPDERRAALALLIFTGGGSLVLEIGRRHPEWMPGLLAVRGASRLEEARPRSSGDSGIVVAGLLPDPAALAGVTPPESTGEAPRDSGTSAQALESPSNEPARRAGKGKAGKAPPAPVDVNVAGADLLCTLPGIGPALAARIIEDRSRNGAFRKPEDLRRVKGIGPATLEKLRPHIRLGGP